MVEPTHLKIVSQNENHLPQFSGCTWTKYLSCRHLVLQNRVLKTKFLTDSRWCWAVTFGTASAWKNVKIFSKHDANVCCLPYGWSIPYHKQIYLHTYIINIIHYETHENTINHSFPIPSWLDIGIAECPNQSRAWAPKRSHGSTKSAALGHWRSLSEMNMLKQEPWDIIQTQLIYIILHILYIIVS